jgi:hypothetical protein
MEMLKTGKKLSALVAGLVALAGCQDERLPSGPEADPAGSRGAEGRPAQSRRPTLDEEYAGLARDVPGFGGLFYDGQGSLHVYLKDPGRGPAVKAAIEAFVQSRRLAGATEAGESRAVMRFRQARFDFGELAGVKKAVDNVVWRAPGVVFTDVDDAGNVVTVATRDAASAERVRNLVQALAIPAGSVEVIEYGPVTSLANLRNPLSPRVGALGESHSNPIPSGTLQNCTIGFNAWNWVGRRVYVTNKHCTATPGVLNGEVHYQAGQFVGTEYEDREYFEGWEGSDCPVGRWCGYADAALVAYDASVTSSYARIAWTGLNPCTTTACGIEIKGQMVVNGKYPLYPAVGTTLNKTGQRTGWTRGQITRACVTEEAPDQRVDLGGIVYLCQFVVGAHANNGDSGSPVYTRTTTVSNTPGNANIYGILWGGNAARTEYFFSPMVAIEDDYGWLDVAQY